VFRSAFKGWRDKCNTHVQVFVIVSNFDLGYLWYPSRIYIRAYAEFKNNKHGNKQKQKTIVNRKAILPNSYGEAVSVTTIYPAN